MQPPSQSDRPYATPWGFYIGDRVEMHLPGGTKAMLGRIVNISPDRLPVVKLDSGVIWNADEEWLTRIKD